MQLCLLAIDWLGRRSASARDLLEDEPNAAVLSVQINWRLPTSRLNNRQIPNVQFQELAGTDLPSGIDGSNAQIVGSEGFEACFAFGLFCMQFRG